MALNPCCCGISLQSASKIIAILYIIGSLLFVVLSILGFIVYGAFAFSKDTKWPEGNKLSQTEFLVTLIWMVVNGLIHLVLAVILWQGVRYKNITKCRVWMISTAVIVFLPVAEFMAVGVDLETDPNLTFTRVTLGLSFTCFLTLIQVYFLLVVNCFVQQIRDGKRLITAA